MNEMEFNDSAFETNGKTDLEEISAFIKNLKLKTVAIGGVDKAAVLDAIREMYRMFSKSYDDLNAKLAMQRDIEASLRKNQAPLERQIAAMKAENESLAQAVKQQSENSDMVAELENKYRRRESEAQSEIDDLRKRLKSRDGEIEELERKYQRELELAKAGAAEKGETLEEIYLDARRSRSEMLEQAQRSADEILQKVSRDAEERSREFEEEFTARQQQAEQLIAEKRQLAEQIVMQAHEDATQIRSEAEAEQRQSREVCENNEALSRKIIADAELEGKKIIEIAKSSYLHERKKYDEMLVRLGSLRAQTVQAIRDDVAKLNELVFGMTGSGIETDTVNLAGLSGIDADGEQGASPENQDGGSDAEA